MRIHSIILADDHPAFMEGVAMKLEREQNLKIVGRAFNGREALELVASSPPDLLVIDMDMPEMTGLEVVLELKGRRDSPVKVLPLSGHSDPEYVLGTMEAGAEGYMLKNESLADIVQGVQKVLGGGVAISDRVSQQIMTRQLRRKKRLDEMDESTRTLLEMGITPRLLRVLRLVARGMSNKDIARELYRSEHTIRNQVDRLKTVSGVRWRPAIVAWGWRIGVFDIDQRDYEEAFEASEYVRKNRA